MKARIYNLIYGIYSSLFGTDDLYETAFESQYEEYGIEMLESILEYLKEPYTFTKKPQKGEKDEPR